MKIFIDSADVKDVENAFSTGIVDGVTTNPSLIAKNGRGFKDVVRNICQIAEGGPVSVEVSATDYDNMLSEGETILGLADNVVLKLPITWDGIKACKHFSSMGKEVNMTLCFSSNQALLAARAGAKYVSPFIGRLDDIGQDGMHLIEDIRSIYNNYPEYDVNLLAASVRHVQHFYQVCLIGADAVTLPWSIINKLVEHPLTTKGLEMFVSDWKKSGLKIGD